MKEKVVLLTQSFPPETGAPANRIGPMADALNKYCEVVVVTLRPSYPSPSEYEGVPLRDHDARYPYTIKRTFHFHPHKGSLLFRSVREQIMALRLALRALLEPADILVTSSPSMFLGPVGLAVAKVRRAKFAWDVRDITWGYAKEVAGASPVMTFAIRMLERYISYALRRADVVIGASHGITKVLVEGGVEAGKTITVPNGISASLLGDIVQRTGEKANNQRPIVGYAGLVGYNQSLGVLVDVAQMLPDIDFVLAGDGPELPLLKEKAKNLGVRNVSFTGYLGRNKLLEFYRQSDILLAHTRSSPTIDATMIPVKLFEYMATGRPILYAGNGVAADLLNQVGCAVTVAPEDPEAISAAIVKLLRDPEQMRVLGFRGRARVQTDFHREKLMEELANAFKERFSEAYNG